MSVEKRYVIICDRCYTVLTPEVDHDTAYLAVIFSKASGWSEVETSSLTEECKHYCPGCTGLHEQAATAERP